ncbi:sulfite exporter TauE/SafE family protein [Castellaniella sp. FW104-16D08]|uniref:sulfite exporter TauE/SafE family protein n=1 Tax=unclassified Castellaniella TaxID=2617606 RepID=UPI0033146FD0
MSPTIFMLIGLAVFTAAFAQGSSGMGFAMLSAPIVTLFAPGLIPVMLLVLMIPLNAYVGWRERAAIDWRGVKLISIGRFAGTFLGLWILLVVNLHQLSLLIGWSTLIAAIVALLSPSFDLGKKGLGLVGLITGITETSTGVGGPPLALAYQHKSGSVLRSTVALCFLVGEVISIVVLAIGGKVDAHTLLVSLQMLPFLVLGSYASKFVHHRLDGPLLRYLVLGFSSVSGIVVILQA